MSDTVLAFIVISSLLAAMLIWVPLLQSAEALTRCYPLQRSEELTSFEEEDSSPQFTGDVA